MLKFWRCIVNSSKQSFLSLQEKATTSYHQPKQRRRTALLQRGERSSCSTLFLQGDRGWEGGKSSSKAQRQPSSPPREAAGPPLQHQDQTRAGRGGRGAPASAPVRPERGRFTRYCLRADLAAGPARPAGLFPVSGLQERPDSPAPVLSPTEWPPNTRPQPPTERGLAGQGSEADLQALLKAGRGRGGAVGVGSGQEVRQASAGPPRPTAGAPGQRPARARRSPQPRRPPGPRHRPTRPHPVPAPPASGRGRWAARAGAAPGCWWPSPRGLRAGPPPPGPGPPAAAAAMAAPPLGRRQTGSAPSPRRFVRSGARGPPQRPLPGPARTAPPPERAAGGGPLGNVVRLGVARMRGGASRQGAGGGRRPRHPQAAARVAPHAAGPPPSVSPGGCWGGRALTGGRPSLFPLQCPPVLHWYCFISTTTSWGERSRHTGRTQIHSAEPKELFESNERNHKTETGDRLKSPDHQTDLQNKAALPWETGRKLQAHELLSKAKL